MTHETYCRIVQHACRFLATQSCAQLQMCDLWLTHELVLEVANHPAWIDPETVAAQEFIKRAADLLRHAAPATSDTTPPPPAPVGGEGDYMETTSCPFCGHAQLGVFAGRQLPSMVVCLAPHCGATGPEAATAAEAWRRWQGRAEQRKGVSTTEEPATTPDSPEVTLLEEISSLLQKQEISRIKLCNVHAKAVRAAMPYPVQGVHWHMFGRPVDTVEERFDCLLCTLPQAARE